MCLWLAYPPRPDPNPVLDVHDTQGRKGRCMAEGPDIRPGPPWVCGINTITLSTSTMGRNTASDGAAFAPVSPTGLGMAYSVGRDGMQWTGSSYKTSPNLSDFVECIQQASDEIHEVLKKP